jgi:hypothetical protein
MHDITLAAVHAAILAEVQDDPTQRGYAGKTRAEIAALLNAPVAPPTAHRDVSISDVEGYLRARLLVTRLRAWEAGAADGLARDAARELLDIIASPRLAMFTTSTDSGRANILGLFATLVAAQAGGITQQHADDLAAMTLAPAESAAAQPSRWVEIISGIGGEGNEPGPPNAATEALVEGALNG